LAINEDDVTEPTLIQTFGWEQLNRFPVWHVYFFVGGRGKVYSQTVKGQWPDLLPPWVRHWPLSNLYRGSATQHRA